MRSLSRKHWAVLWCLRREPGMTAKQLAMVLGSLPVVMYLRLNRLQESGLVRVVEHPGSPDQIRFRYYLSKAAEQSTIGRPTQ